MIPSYKKLFGSGLNKNHTFSTLNGEIRIRSAHFIASQFQGKFKYLKRRLSIPSCDSPAPSCSSCFNIHFCNYICGLLLHSCVLIFEHWPSRALHSGSSVLSLWSSLVVIAFEPVLFHSHPFLICWHFCLWLLILFYMVCVYDSNQQEDIACFVIILSILCCSNRIYNTIY